MSDLRYFADMMHEAIAREAQAKAVLSRLHEIQNSAEAYRLKCAQERVEAVKALIRADEIPEAFHKANEGLCAVRIIMGERP